MYTFIFEKRNLKFHLMVSKDDIHSIGINYPTAGAMSGNNFRFNRYLETKQHGGLHNGNLYKYNCHLIIRIFIIAQTYSR
jgi:hypothetical protein